MNILAFFIGWCIGTGIGLFIVYQIFKPRRKKAQKYADLFKAEIDSQTTVPFTDEELITKKKY